MSIAVARPHFAPIAIGLAPVAFWTMFAAAAVVFALDATTTIVVTAIQPLAVEQNPVARWMLDLHPLAPYVLKTAIVAQCAVTAAVMRARGERWAALSVGALMCMAGLIGIATGFQALAI